MPEQITEEKEEKIISYDGIPKEDFITGGSGLDKGCGVLLGIRLALKITGPNTVLLISGSFHERAITPKIPVLVMPELAIPYKFTKENEVLLAFDLTGDINNIIEASKKADIVITCNNEERPIAKLASAAGVDYTATATLSNIIDYLNKIKRAMKYKSSVIQLFAPCPQVYGYDPSDTIELCRRAVATNAWPLYELVKRKFVLSERVRILTPADVFYRSFNSKKTPEELEKIQKRMKTNWNLMKEGSFWETK